MTIRDCRVIAVEGAHGTGKSTLVHALVAHYKSNNIHAACLAELARESPFVEEAVIHEYKSFDITSELHLFASQIAREQLLARFHELLICDKTIANVLGYSRIFLKEEENSFNREVLSSIDSFCRVYVKQYDAVVYVSDIYDLTDTEDPFRPQDPKFQKQADKAIRQVCKDINLPLLEMPRGLSLDDKVGWITEHVSLDLGK